MKLFRIGLPVCLFLSIVGGLVLEVAPVLAYTGAYVVIGQIDIVNGTGTLSSSPTRISLAQSPTQVTVTDLGNFTVYVANGCTASVYSGTTTVTGSPVSCAQGATTSFTTTGSTGYINVSLSVAGNYWYGSLYFAQWGPWAFANSSGGLPDSYNSGGVPDTNTNVYIDANSYGYNGERFSTEYNPSYCHDFNCTGFDKTGCVFSVGDGSEWMEYSGQVISGNFIGASGLTITGNGGWSTLSFTSPSGTFTSNGCAFSLNFGFSGSYTIEDQPAWTGCNVSCSGTLNMNGYSVTVSTWQQTTGTLILAGTVLTCSVMNGSNDQFVGANTATFTGGTIQLQQYNGSASFNGGGGTYNNVVFSTPSGTQIGHIVLDGNANHFANLTCNGGNDGISGQNESTMTISGDQNISGTLTITGYDPVHNRERVESSVAGANRQLSAGTVSITNCDISDMTGAGSGSWDISAGQNVDYGGNIGITFTEGANQYWVGNNGSFDDVTHWASSSGGVGGTGRVPLAQDTAVFDANSCTLPSRTITLDVQIMSGINASAIANDPTFSGSVSEVDVYGDLNLGICTWTVTTTKLMGGTGGTDNTLTAANATVNTNLYIQKSTSPACTEYLGSNATVNGTTYLISGAFNLEGYNFTTADFNSVTTTYARTLIMGAGTLTITDTGTATKWYVAASNLTITPNTSTIVLTNSTSNPQYFQGGGFTYYNLSIIGAGNYALTFDDSNSFNQISVDRTAAAKTIAGNFTETLGIGSGGSLVCPASATTVLSISNTDFSKSSGTVVLDYLAFTSGNNTCIASGGATFYAGVHSTGSPQTGWNFNSPTAPAASTVSATNILTTSATLTGNLTSMGGYGTLSAYFIYSIDPAFTTYAATNPQTNMTGTGTFTATATGLTTLTTYYFEAVVAFSGTPAAYGSGVSFFTGAPSITTLAATGIDTSSGTLNGQLDGLGGFSTCNVFFRYGTTSSMTLSTTPQTETVAGVFHYDVTSLQSGITYYFEACATYNSGSEVDGSMLTFDTAAAPAPTAPSPDSQGSITLGEGDTYQKMLGPTLSGALDTMGSWFGTDGRGMGGAIVFIILCGIMIALSRIGYPLAGIGLGFPLQLGAAYVGLWDWAFVGVTVFIFALIWAYQTWFDR